MVDLAKIQYGWSNSNINHGPPMPKSPRPQKTDTTRKRPARHGSGRHRSGPFSPNRRSREGISNPDGVELIYGLHATEFALSNKLRTVTAVFATENAERKLKAVLEPRQLTLTRVSPRDLDKRLGGDTVHQGILLEVEPLETPSLNETIAKAKAANLPIVVLDQVTDPHNVGAALRSCAVFGATGLVMTHRHSPPLGGTLAKSASGALDLVPVCLVQNLAKAVSELQEHNFMVIGLDGESEHRLLDVAIAETERPVALVLGAEGKGLRELTRQSCDELCRIGGDGPIASLNVSNAAAVALHLAAMQRRGNA